MILRPSIALALVVAVAAVPAAGQRIKLAASLSDLEARARTDSNDAAAHYNVALAYWNAKRWDDAGRSLRLAVAIALVRIERLVGLFHRDRIDESAPASLLWYRALAAAHVEKYQEAQRDLQELLARADSNERSDSLVRIPLEANEYRYVLAYVRHRAGDPNGAIYLYRQALETDVGLYMAHVRLAEIYEGAQRWDQAVTHRQSAVSSNPDDPSLLIDLGRTLGSAGRLAEAFDPLQEAVAANPRDSRGWYYLGVVAQQLNKKEEARGAFSRFIALAPSRYARQLADAKQRLNALR